MKNVCLVTGSRAEYGIQKRLIKQLEIAENIDFDLVVTGMHLEEKYGYTKKAIIDDNISIYKDVPLYMKDTSKKTVVRAMSILLEEMGTVFEEKEYDLLILLGDRFEMLSVANAALIYGIPICHIHGGEKTLGNYDEFIRHSLTKMSHLHLTSTEIHSKRLIQMGENPKNVHNIGAMGVENVLNEQVFTKTELEAKLELELAKDYYVVLFHPVTLEDQRGIKQQINELLNAMKKTNKQIIFIGSNADTGSDDIAVEIKKYLDGSPESKSFRSLSTEVFHSLVRNSKGLVGNSSSGLIEVPSLKVPTLNIGNRQKGRTSGKSVVSVGCNEKSISQGIETMNKIVDFVNPYEKENSSKLAFEIIQNELNNNLTTFKDFIDFKENSK